LLENVIAQNSVLEKQQQQQQEGGTEEEDMRYKRGS
jgi:hypothetical protein